MIPQPLGRRLGLHRVVAIEPDAVNGALRLGLLRTGLEPPPGRRQYFGPVCGDTEEQLQAQLQGRAVIRLALQGGLDRPERLVGLHPCHMIAGLFDEFVGGALAATLRLEPGPHRPGSPVGDVAREPVKFRRVRRTGPGTGEHFREAPRAAAETEGLGSAQLPAAACPETKLRGKPAPVGPGPGAHRRQVFPAVLGRGLRPDACPPPVNAVTRVGYGGGCLGRIHARRIDGPDFRFKSFRKEAKF